MNIIKKIARFAGIVAVLILAIVISIYVVATTTSAFSSAQLGAVFGFVSFALIWGGGLSLILPGRPGMNLSGGLLVLTALVWLYPFGAALLLHAPGIPIEAVSSSVAERSEVALSKGDRMALWTIQADVSNRQEEVVLFVPGGPGGRVSEGALSFLSEFAEAGYTVFGYDHYGAGYSQYHNPDLSLLTMDDEIRRLAEIVALVRDGRPVHLIGHSYAGMLIGRYLSRYPHTAASFVALDTSGLFSIRRGNTKSRLALDETLQREAGNRTASARTRTVLGGTELKRFFAIQAPHTALRRLLIFFWRNETGAPRLGSVAELDAAERYLDYAKTESSHTDGPPNALNGASAIAQLITQDVEQSDDYYENLIAAETPPVLVFRPEHSDIPWQVHRDYASLFDKVTIVPVPNAGHVVWSGMEELVAAQASAFFQGRLDENLIYEGRKDPFRSNSNRNHETE